MRYKFITTILCLAVLSLTACGNNADTVSKNDVVMENVEMEKSTEDVESTEKEETLDTTENMEETEETPNPQTIVVKELNQTMYAKSAVNVRKGDSTDYEKIGSLSFNQQVQVTGQSEATGWYRIEFNGEVGFVSKNYLSTEKTVVTQSQNQNNNGNNNSSNNGGGGNSNSGGGSSSNEESDEPEDWEAPEGWTDEPVEGEITIDLEANDAAAGPWSGLVTDIELNDPDAP